MKQERADGQLADARPLNPSPPRLAIGARRGLLSLRQRDELAGVDRLPAA